MVMKRFAHVKPKRFGGGSQSGKEVEGRHRKGLGKGKSPGGKKSKCKCDPADPSTDVIAKPVFESQGNACKICTILSPQKQLFYSEAWTPGDIQTALPMPIKGSKQGSSTTLDHISKLRRQLQERYGITVQDCEHHARVCIRKKEDSRYTKVATQFDQLWEALDLAHSVYMDDPSMFNANAYTALTRELRGCLMDLNKVQSSDEVADEITATALNPMVKRMTTAIITEASRLKEDLLARFSEEDADKVVNSYVERLAVQIQDTVPFARDRIADALSARDKNRKKALAGKATMKRGKATGIGHTDSETKGKLLSLPTG